MATKKLSDYLLPPAPLSGGSFGIANTTPKSLPNTYVSPGSIRDVGAPPQTPMTPEARAALRAFGARNSAPAPAVAGPLFQQGPTGPASDPGPIAPSPTGSTGSTGSQVPSQYLKADGSFKTPDEIAADVAGTLKAAHGHGDVPSLALQQFSGADKSVEELSADARRIGNARNDLAVGETDPYKVASQSGIAYTPAELSAIEKAYAGIYDPALDTALSKVTQKQTTDKAAADSAARIAEQKAAPYTLGPTDVRFSGDGSVISKGNSAGNSGTYVKGSNPVVDAYVLGSQNGIYKPSDIPEAYKGLVAQGLAAGTGANAPLSKTSTDALGILHSLQGQDLGTLSGTGVVGALEHPSSLFPGTDVQKTQNLAKQLQATLSLANRLQLKGQGAISDFEFRVLGDAATALGLDESGRTNLSEKDFKDQLGKLELKLQVGPTKLTDDEIQYLHDVKGYTADDIRKIDSPQSFEDVGNTIASTSSEKKGNIPQRNNNPGNVKSGGLADALATGKDQYGHLIFPDAATGFKALTADLTAKINRGTARLPVNPTIAQLGKVYAEDPNWPIKVAQILGVPVETHTQTVPIEKLVKAVATQEGFYA